MAEQSGSHQSRLRLGPAVPPQWGAPGRPVVTSLRSVGAAIGSSVVPASRGISLWCSVHFPLYTVQRGGAQTPLQQQIRRLSGALSATPAEHAGGGAYRGLHFDWAGLEEGVLPASNVMVPGPPSGAGVRLKLHGQ